MISSLCPVKRLCNLNYNIIIIYLINGAFGNYVYDKVFEFWEIKPKISIEIEYECLIGNIMKNMYMN